MELDGPPVHPDSQDVFHPRNTCHTGQPLDVARGLVSGRDRPVVAGPLVNVRSDVCEDFRDGLVDIADEILDDESSARLMSLLFDAATIRQYPRPWSGKYPYRAWYPGMPPFVASENEAMLGTRRVA